MYNNHGPFNNTIHLSLVQPINFDIFKFFFQSKPYAYSNSSGGWDGYSFRILDVLKDVLGFE